MISHLFYALVFLIVWTLAALGVGSWLGRQTHERKDRR